MSDFKNYLNKQLQDPEFREEYEKTRPDYEILHSLIQARLSQNLTQKQLAEKTGIKQANISRIENGVCSPTIYTLQLLAKGIGKKLVVSFE